MSAIGGVNIGGWLVLERWMTPSLFADTDCLDEYGLMQRHHSRLHKHRSSFITEHDIAFLADQGVKAVRLPVPHWLFGDYPPYQSCADRVDWFLAEAARSNISVLIDMHTVPGSQNGEAHSGRKGNIGWPSEVTVEQTLNVLSNVALSYGDHPAVMGIELVNEPSARIPHEELIAFYRRGIEAVRAAAPTCMIAVHDAYRPYDWLTPQLTEYDNIMLDVHLYRAFGADARLSFDEQLEAVASWQPLIQALQQHMPVIVGEWSLGLAPTAHASVPAGASAQKLFYDAQMESFAQAYAHFFWSYKTEDISGWDYRTVLSMADA